MLQPLKFSPAAQGFCMPAEWEPHAGTWLTYPHSTETWEDRLSLARSTYIQFIGALAKGERVHINVQDEATKTDLKEKLDTAGLTQNVQLHLQPTNCEWIRDYGGIFIRHPETGELAVTDWIFNNWGGKYIGTATSYANLDLANAIPKRMAEAYNAERIVLDFILEGGSIETNGKGLLMTSESCLLNPNRNPKYTRAEIEQLLCDYLGAKKVLWLEDGIVGDDTDGHVDDTVRFVNENTVVAAVESNPEDPNFHPLQTNLARLSSMTDLDGQPLNIIPLPMPKPVFDEGVQLPASYANFYIGNAAVLVPTFRCEQDAEALHILQNCFPDRAVVGLDYHDLIIGLGSFHCLSQQIPAGVGKAGTGLLSSQVGW